METISKTLVLGSGSIKIAEAAEFDYSGSQALKALKEEGIKTILVNPNVATFQTTYELADKLYLLPLKLQFVEKVIEKEAPDSILLGFGGQTALSLGVALHKRGTLRKYGVKVLGTPISGIESALNRELFRNLMIKHSLPVPPSSSARTVSEALSAAKLIGYPVMCRVSFNLGGRGSFVAWNERDLRASMSKALAHSEIALVLIEKYLHHWKEVEFEVVRDYKGNSVAVCCMENADPMGVHTGDSVVVAPSQTLNNREYQTLRDVSIKVANAINLIGECNVQLALDPGSEEFYVIETNPRMSRSSALASKASGYPLAYIAAKLALGYTLDELLNKVTGVTTACFEPSMDYVVVKVPRWDLDKFEFIDKSVNTEMMSVGEVMAIGRNIQEALQKAIRMLDIGEDGVVATSYVEEPEDLSDVLAKLKKRVPYWPLHVAKALKLGASVEAISAVTGIDRFFINAIKELVELSDAIEKRRHVKDLSTILDLIVKAKECGFSDRQLARLLNRGAEEVREFRRMHGIVPRVKQIDTLAAEWPAKTNYLYLTYNGFEDDVNPRSDKRGKILVLGAGGFRIGVSVEFDWCTVNITNALRRRGYEVIVLNCNPETVSTDWDVNEKLYFDEVTLERVRDIVEFEEVDGVITFVGGQIANNLAKKLEECGVKLLGTSGYSVDRCEDRVKFSKLAEKLGISIPEWSEARSVEEMVAFVKAVGLPVIIRPSYVLSGTAMKVAYSLSELLDFVKYATKVSPEHPVVISKFYDNSLEVEVDAVSDGRRVIGATIEHIEPAGVHSGDATMVIPTRVLSADVLKRIHDDVFSLASELEIKGPFNVQFVVKGNKAYVLEVNLRASRSMPFSSKAKGVNLMELTADVITEGRLSLGVDGEYYELPSKSWAVKSPQFSWAQLRGSYPYLGPEMRSTGEVASLGGTYEDALLKSWLSAHPNRVPELDKYVLIYGDEKDGALMGEAAEAFISAGYKIASFIEKPINTCSLMLDRSSVLEHLKRGMIDLVVTSGYMPEVDYGIRRTAADLNVPLILNAKLGLEIAKAIEYFSKRGEFEILEAKEYW